LGELTHGQRRVKLVRPLKDNVDMSSKSSSYFERMSRRFQFTSRVKSIGYAIQGIWYVLRSQHNAWIHAVITVLVVAAGFCFGLAADEWCWIVIAAALVWTAEALNTAVELLADTITKDVHPLIGQAKDVAAGAVLLTAIGASVIGVIVFWPYIHALFLGIEIVAP
jgi:diacylglycerol kinase (ATP)